MPSLVHSSAYNRHDQQYKAAARHGSRSTQQACKCRQYLSQHCHASSAVGSGCAQRCLASRRQCVQSKAGAAHLQRVRPVGRGCCNDDALPSNANHSCSVSHGQFLKGPLPCSLPTDLLRLCHMRSELFPVLRPRLCLSLLV